MNIEMKIAGSFFGILGYVLFSLALLLSSRWHKLEDLIGGLDRIYHYHRQLGIWSFICVLMHPFVLAARWLPHRLDKFLLFVLPIHKRISVNFGSLAFLLMLIILTVTLLKLLAYNHWKILHKFMSLVFLLASLHILLANKRMSLSPLIHDLLFIPMAVGFFGIFYKQIALQFFIKPFEYEVTNSKIINDNIVQITLQQLKNAFHFVPGQYGFFRFVGPSLSRESHPFTFIKISGSTSSFYILVKARGDYTKNLFQHISKGYLTYIEGPYGRFDYTKAGKDQIWISGGIGITPFLSWLKAIDTRFAGKIDLYYCVHRKVDAIFLDELDAIKKTMPQFHYFIFCSEENNRLNAQKVLERSGSLVDKHILMCGPKKLTTDLNRQFRASGVKKENVMFEDFEFF